MILGSGVVAVFVITAVLDYFDLNIDYLMLCLWPLFLYLYYYFICNIQRQIAILYSFVIYLAVESTDTFLSVITSSVFGDSIIHQCSDYYFFDYPNYLTCFNHEDINHSRSESSLF